MNRRDFTYIGGAPVERTWDLVIDPARIDRSWDRKTWQQVYRWLRTCRRRIREAIES